MSNKNWFDSILSVFSSKEEGCYSCLNGLDCPQHKVTLAKGVDQTKLSTPGLKQLAKDVADAQQVLSKDTKDLEEAKAELTRAENTLQFQEELYSMSVKLVEDIAETRISAAAKKEAIKAKNLAINANDGILSQWATISLEQRIADATARLQKAAPTIVSAPAAPSQPKFNPPKGEDATKAIAALVALGLTEGQASLICKLSSAKDVAAQVERWIKSGKAHGAAAIAKALVGVGHRKGLWAKYVSVKAPTQTTAPAPAGPAYPDPWEAETQTTTTTTAKRRNTDEAPAESSDKVATDVEDPNFGDPDTVVTAPTKEQGQNLRQRKHAATSATSAPSDSSGNNAFEIHGVDIDAV